ncbi:16S rRNA (cytosine(1402)-N(4))-methyltransferase, partial [candidate division WWE3 bacterium RBG_13_37_7]
MKYHEPVLLSEVLEHLKVNKGKKYIDCTLGDGGHAIEILKKGGIVLGLDINEESLQRAKQRITQELDKSLQKNFFAVLGNFKNIDELVKGGLLQDFSQVDGILYDLGYSSFQMDEGEEGLSFQRDLPLDMRLDKSLGVTAADLINVLSESQLTELIF